MTREPDGVALSTANNERDVASPARGLPYCGLDVAPAGSLDELEQAYALVHENYVRMGYCKDEPPRLRYSLHNALPETVTFVGTLGTVVAATVTLFADSPLGLPLDEIYQEQADELRRERRKVAEVGMLADRRDFTPGGMRRLPALLRLFKLVYDRCRCSGVDDILLTCHPRHNQFYVKYLGVEQFGPEIPLPSVQDAPATLFRIDVHTFAHSPTLRKSLRRILLAEATPREVIDARYRFDEPAFRRLFAEIKPLLRGASDAVASHLADRYPNIAIRAICAGGQTK